MGGRGDSGNATQSKVDSGFWIIHVPYNALRCLHLRLPGCSTTSPFGMYSVCFNNLFYLSLTLFFPSVTFENVNIFVFYAIFFSIHVV